MPDTDEPRATDGKPVTDEIIQRLADEADAGYDVATLRRKGGRRPIGRTAAHVVPVRLDPELEQAVKAASQGRPH